MQWHAGAKHARAGIIGDYFDHEDGGSTVVDD
jgi:hypothetical protein